MKLIWRFNTRLVWGLNTRLIWRLLIQDPFEDLIQDSFEGLIQDSFEDNTRPICRLNTRLVWRLNTRLAWRLCTVFSLSVLCVPFGFSHNYICFHSEVDLVFMYLRNVRFYFIYLFVCSSVQLLGVHTFAGFCPMKMIVPNTCAKVLISCAKALISCAKIHIGHVKSVHVQDPNTKRFRWTHIYFDTDTQYAHLFYYLWMTQSTSKLKAPAYVKNEYIRSCISALTY